MAHLPLLQAPDVLRAAELLHPIGRDMPCGPALEYDPEYAVLRSRLASRGEAQYGEFVSASDGPDWGAIDRDCRRLLARTKDITLFIWLCRARIRLGQAAGFAQVLAALAAALAAWPEDLHPQPVLEGEFDPGVRANALASLADPEGLLGDVREIVVSSSTAMHLTVRDVERAFVVPRPPDAPLPEAVTRQLVALRQANDDSGAALQQLAQAAQALKEIDCWCKLCLADDAPVLAALQRLLDPFSDTGQLGLLHEGSASPPEPASTMGRAPGVAFFEPIATRHDAKLAVRRAREWFEIHEPSSPVAVLLQRAERLVGLRFSQLAQSIPYELLQKWESEEDLPSNP